MAEETKRVTLRMYPQDQERLAYWANKAGESINEFVVTMLDLYVSIQNGDYAVPTVGINRLNQLIESQQVLVQNVASLEEIVVSGFDSLLSLTRGDNYLLEEEDGEI